MMMLIPEAWAGNAQMDPERRSFYEYHAALMEPWDGPAAVCFTDGRQIGATLDRNGLRPARFCVTKDDIVCLASESGVLPFAEEDITRKWRLQPGKMLLIDLEQGRIIEDEELKADLSGAEPYAEWLDQAQFKLEDISEIEPELSEIPESETTLLQRQQAFGYTQEDIARFLEPMAVKGDDPIGSMGTDTPIAVLSDKARLLYDYFKQNFAQVTNPPIDPIREELVMSLLSMIGPRPNLLGHDAGTHKRLEVHQPILTNDDLAKIRSVEAVLDGAFRCETIDITFDAEAGVEGVELALKEMCWAATEAVLQDQNILVLSDRAQSEGRVPIPALLATAAVHHHLVRQGLRMQTGLVVETGEAREVHHFCVLAGYGAEAINPYVAFETLEDIRVRKHSGLDSEEVQQNYIKAIGKGIRKVMSKMGISTYQSYCGAQIFDAVGLSDAFVEKYFTGTATTIDGVGLAEVAEESVRRHAQAYGDNPLYKGMLDVGGIYQYRLRGEEHAWTPENVAQLQHAVRGNDHANYDEFAKSVNEQSERLLTIRGLMEFKTDNAAVPLDEVEPASEIVKRFSTGAMSFGSIRLDQPRSALNAGHGDEPHWRSLEHWRRRRRAVPFPTNGKRRFDAQPDQASGLWPFWRDDRIPRQFGRYPDQDGAGREARRRRPATRSQGRQADRGGAPFDPGRRPDLAAAASRYLLYRRSRAADPRSQEREHRSAHFGKARLRSGCRYSGCGRVESTRRSRHDLRL